MWWDKQNFTVIAAGHQPAAYHILEQFEIFHSMVPWFDVQSNCDCSAVQSVVCLRNSLAAAPIFLLGATRHFVWLSCKIRAEIVVYRMFAVFLNGLNGKKSSRRQYCMEHFFICMCCTSTWPVNKQVLAFTLFVRKSSHPVPDDYSVKKQPIYQHCCCFRISWIIKMNYKMVLKP